MTKIDNSEKIRENPNIAVIPSMFNIFADIPTIMEYSGRYPGSPSSMLDPENKSPPYFM